MFEVEVKHTPLARAEVGEDAVAAFENDRLAVDGWCLVSWGEHCTECAAPACFSSCSFYQARSDGICRRFKGGIRPLAGIDNDIGHIASITFGKWGKVMAYAHGHVVPSTQAAKWERRWLGFDRLCSKMPALPFPRTKLRRGLFSPLAYWLKKSQTRAGRFSTADLSVNAFVVEVFNPQDAALDLRLDFCHETESGFSPPFSEKLTLEPGMNRCVIPRWKIEPFVDFDEPFLATMTPATQDGGSPEGLTLFFGLTSFVALPERLNTPTKFVVWDLDNTLWDGVLVEDGIDELTVNTALVQFIKDTDATGIIHGIASKNDFDPAMAALKQFGLADLFVFPKISWDEKGAAIAEAIKDVNVGADTVVFVDDQPFERAQVQHVNPEVRTFSPEEVLAYRSCPIFCVEGSAKSGHRRASYQAAEKRQKEEAGFTGDYEEFLRNCEMEVGVVPAGMPQLDRIHELCQRTNQLNFSGNRYSKQELCDIIDDEGKRSWIVSAKDRFGNYGIIGFVIYDLTKRTLDDVIFSCRIQRKMVDVGFLVAFFNRFLDDDEIYLRWRKTKRNEKNGAVFAEVGFREEKIEDDVTILSCSRESARLEQTVVTVRWEESE